jgi:diketogulonate reductase-like aldo/keto reductase
MCWLPGSTTTAGRSPGGTATLGPLASLLGLLREIGARREKSPSEVALRLLIQLEGVLPIPGAKNASQATGNAGAFTFTLEPDEVDARRCHLNSPKDGLGE